MGDAIDQAQDLAMMYQEQTRTRVLQNLQMKPQNIPIPTHRECIDCGDPIPQERLQARPGSVRCIDCQERKERRDRMK